MVVGRSSRMVAAVLAAVLVFGIAPGAARQRGAAVPDPVVEGPVTGGVHGRPWHSSTVDVTEHGFVEEEYFIGGTSGSRTYKTRIVVRRPADDTFSGTVIVDWINVTGGTDLETLWPPAMPMYFNERHAYVGLTAQLVGVNGLKAWDPVRYATLLHPGDSPHSFEILAQAVQAIRSPKGIDPMGGLDVEHVLVGGSSQSAGRLVSYITGGYPIVGHIDGFWISRAGGGASIHRIAEELGVPMIHSFEEGLSAQPADNDFYRVWEGAGQAHAPKSWHDYVWDVYQRDLWANAVDLPNPLDMGCAMNRGTVGYQIRAGLDQLDTWVRSLDDEEGPVRAPIAPRITRDAGGSQVRDADGNVVGGLRYPFIDVPLGTNTGSGCPLFGTYYAWSKAKILERYPTHADYYEQVEASVQRLLDGGFLKDYDAEEILAAAEAFDIWDKGTCWDTTRPDEDEDGPVSSALAARRAEHSRVRLGVPALVGEVSCNLAALGL
jgi:hypothetical protein